MQVSQVPGLCFLVGNISPKGVNRVAPFTIMSIANVPAEATRGDEISWLQCVAIDTIYRGSWFDVS